MTDAPTELDSTLLHQQWRLRMDDKAINDRPALGEITLKELLDLHLKHKMVILCITVISALLCAFAGKWIPKKYEASVTLSPVSSSSANGQLGSLSSVTSQFSGLASLAGLSVGGDSRKWESLTVLQSESLTERYIADNNLLPILYPDKWDAKAKRWIVQNPKETPTLWKANQYFKKQVRKVTTDPKTGMVTLTITWKDPITAAKWANDLVGLTNNRLREVAIAESERNIAYLSEQAVRTEIIGARQAIYSILQNELNKAMLARGTEEYAFKVLDPAKPPETSSSPSMLVWILIGTFGGLFLSVFSIVLRAALR